MQKKLAYLPKVDLIGVERNLVESLDNSQAFFPEEIIEQPFGHGTKTYNFKKSIHMIYDMEPFSSFTELRDPLNLITQRPNQGQIVNSQILNVVTGHSVKGETFYKPGDLFTYCVTSAFEKVDNQLKYKPEKCQLKFKMRAVATFNKLPGFTRISGYKQINMAGPSLLLTMAQMKHIIDRIT